VRRRLIPAVSLLRRIAGDAKVPVHLRGGLSPRAGRATKPFSLEEVIARIQAVLRRTSSGGYFIGTGGGIRSDSDSTASQEIAAVAADNFTATTVGGVTVYDLTTMATT
jgi:hypothetical protein